MLDIYIYYNDKPAYDAIKDMCFRYLMKKDYEAEVFPFSPEDSGNNASIFMLGLSDETERLSRQLRDKNERNYIVVLLDDYSQFRRAVTPGISPSGMVVRPWNKEDVDAVLDEVYSDFERTSADKNSLGMFTFKQKAKEYTIPYERIIYFESRNKKVIVRTESQELEFYDTLDSVLNAAPDCFMKIHKSFVVNTARIVSADYGAMTVEFDDGSAAFMSRTYKSALKESLSRRAE